MNNPVARKPVYRSGQTWYVKARGENKEVVYYPVKIIGIFPHILLVENKKGVKQAFSKACAFLDLYSEAQAKRLIANS